MDCWIKEGARNGAHIDEEAALCMSAGHVGGDRWHQLWRRVGWQPKTEQSMRSMNMLKSQASCWDSQTQQGISTVVGSKTDLIGPREASCVCKPSLLSIISLVHKGSKQITVMP